MVAVRKILVPVDGSPNSLRALDYAGYFAECCGASIDLLYVVNIASTVAAFSDPSGGVCVPEGVLDDFKELGQATVNKALTRLPSGIVAQGLVEVGVPTEVIVSVSIEQGYDLVVIGSRGLGSIAQLVLGSVSSYVLQRARCPVMIIR